MVRETGGITLGWPPACTPSLTKARRWPLTSLQGYEADKVKKKINIMEKRYSCTIKTIQVEIAGAEGRRGGEQRLRETVFRTHLVWLSEGCAGSSV